MNGKIHKNKKKYEMESNSSTNLHSPPFRKEYALLLQSCDNMFQVPPSLLLKQTFQDKGQGSTFVIITQVSGSQLGQFCIPKDITVGRNFVLSQVRREMLPASPGWWPGELLNLLQCTGESPQQRLAGQLHQQCWGWKTLPSSISDAD